MQPISNNIVHNRSRPTSMSDHGLKVGECFDIGRPTLPHLLARSSHPVAEDPEQFKGGWSRPQRRFLHLVGHHPAREEWEKSLREDVMENCKISGLNWQSIGLYRQGVADKKEDNPPTIIVTVVSSPNEAVYATASELVARIEQMIKGRLADVHVEVISYLPVIPYADNTAEEFIDFLNPTPFIDCIFGRYGTAPPGRSIGPVGTTGTGSLSGFIGARWPTPPGKTAAHTLRKDGSPHSPERRQPTSPGKMAAQTRKAMYALTCHYVAAWDHNPDPLKALVEQDKIQITIPAEGDHAAYVEYCRTRIAAVLRDIAKTEKSIQDQEERGGKTTNLLVLLSMYRKWKQVLDNILSYITPLWNENHVLGTVVHSSGLKNPPSEIGVMDWAMIQPNPAFLRRYQQQRQQMNFGVLADSEQEEYAINTFKSLKISRQPDFINDLSTFFSPQTEAPIVPAEKIRALYMGSDIDDPVYVYVRGRTTPFGVGILHDTWDGVKIERPTGLEETTSRELVILDVRNRDGGPMFSQHGDSGAPVRLDDGSVIGFIRASKVSDQARSVSYVAVGEVMMEDIRKAVGAEEVQYLGGAGMA